MPAVRINPIKNRLYITLRGRDPVDVNAYVQKIESACNALAPSFTCLLVLETNKMIRQKDKDLLFNTTDLISAYGAGRVVYVGKTKDHPKDYKIDPIYFQTFIPIEHARSTTEAEAILDRIPSRMQSTPERKTPQVVYRV